MLPADAIGAALALFIFGMVWLRTRMHYAPAPQGRLHVTAVGAVYFGALAVLLVSGWFVAPRVAPRLGYPVPAIVARAVGFLLLYYLSVPVHRALKAHRAAVFAATVADPSGRR
jgi:hypothetical protein